MTPSILCNRCGKPMPPHPQTAALIERGLADAFTCPACMDAPTPPPTCAICGKPAKWYIGAAWVNLCSAHKGRYTRARRAELYQQADELKIGLLETSYHLLDTYTQEKIIEMARTGRPANA